MKIGSLFSGAGGLDMAVEQVFGAETVWHCEFDAAASKVLSEHWPGVPNHVDVTTTVWADVEPVDILCGGYPCQPFSAAGQRKGTDDERHLWPYFAEAIRVLRPRFVVLENVAGHRSMGFDRVLGDLAEIGYDAQWCSVRASDVGAPHRRERVFVLAVAGGAAEWEFAGGAFAEETGPQASNGFGDHRGERSAGIRRGTASDTSRNRWDEGWPESAGVVGGSNAAVGGDGAVELLQTPSVADSEGSRKARGGDRSNELLLPGQAVEMATSWGRYEFAVRRWEMLTVTAAPAATEPTRAGNPRLSPAFAEWMMGWPAGWVTNVPGLSRNDKLRIIGNGVVPQQAIAALQWLLQIEVAA